MSLTIGIVLNAVVLTAFAIGTSLVAIQFVDKRIASDVEIGEREIKTYSSNKSWYFIPVVVSIIGLILSLVIYYKLFVYKDVVDNNDAFALIELELSYICLVIALIYDYKLSIIPNFIPLSLVVLRGFILPFEFFLRTEEEAMLYLKTSIIGCLLCVFVLLIATYVSRGGMGYGDIKIMGALGLMCGITAVFSTLIFSLFACMIITVALLLMKKKTIKDHLPFGPFIYIGFVLTVVLTIY